MSIRPGDMRPRNRKWAQRVVRVANATWTANGFRTGTRFSLGEYCPIADELLVVDVEQDLSWPVSVVYKTLPMNRRKAVHL